MSRTALSAAHPVQRGVISSTLNGGIRRVSWLLVALLFSIVVEWVGMSLFWKEEGITHSRNMLAQELSYLGSDFQQSIITSSPVQFAETISSSLHHWLFEWTRLTDFVRWVSAPDASQESRLRQALRAIYLPVSDYVLAAITITQLFAVRLAVLILALPAFFLLGLLGLIDGLVERDLRKWGGGRESAYKYHHAKRVVAPSVILVWIIYLAMPVSVNPSFVVLPFALLFAFAIAIASSTFKKYL